MRVLFLTWSDQNLCNANRAAALTRCSDDEGRCWAVKGRNDFVGEEYSCFAESMRAALDWCDVFHVADTYPVEFKAFESASPHGWFDAERRKALAAGKKRVFEFKGGFLRMYSKVFWEWQSKTLTPVITTPDLGRYLPRFHYIPLPLDVWDERYLPVDRDNELLRVCQSPTRRDYKDTDALMRVCDRLDGVELVLLEKMGRGEVLEAKKGCDAYFGKFKVGDFGQSEREALAMGLVVFCRLQPLVVAYNPGCPIVNVGSEEELEEGLKWFSDDPDEVVLMGAESRGWAEEFFSFEAVGPRMAAFYDYVLNGDDWEWWDAHAAIWQVVGRREHGAKDFVNPKEVRW